MIYSLDQLDGEKFDVIVSLKAMHHIPDPLQCVQLLVWNVIVFLLVERIFES